MKLLVYEHITSGALAAEALPASLAHEGDWMLSAIVQDLADLAQFELVLLRDARLAMLDISAQAEYIWVNSQEEMAILWQQCLQQFDLFLIIAPETDNQLIRLQQQVMTAGKTYLGCDIASCRITSDKLLCYQTLLNAAIATPATMRANDWLQSAHSDEQSWIVKPYDGAGCLDTRLFQQSIAVAEFLSQLTDSVRTNMIVQPYIEGLNASLSLFICANHIELLSINRQHIENHAGELHYTHSDVLTTPLPISVQHAKQVALTIKQALPGLWGFVGIDLVIQANGAISVIEINPRLTTSYVNLRAMLPDNPARFLHCFIHERLISL